MWARFTQSVGLLEIREEYMKLGEKLDIDLIRVLARLAPLIFPARVEIYGVTKTGGFSSSYIIDAYGAPEEDLVARYLSRLGEIVYEVVTRRTLGVLRSDGVVRHLSDRVLRVYITMEPLRYRNTFVRLHLARLWLLDESESLYYWDIAQRRLGTKTENAIIVEGDHVERLYRQILSPVWPEPHYTIIEVESKTRRPKLAEERCSCVDFGAYKDIVVGNISGLRVCATVPLDRYCYVETAGGVVEYKLEVSHSIRSVLMECRQVFIQRPLTRVGNGCLERAGP